MPPFPEFDEVMRALLDDIAPVVTFESDQIEAPYIFVTRVGGRATEIVDAPVIDIEYVAATREASKAMRSAGQERILAAGNTAPGGYLIDTADEQTGGRFMPPLRRDDRGVTATVRLSYRRPRG
ncbi:phage tail termination protein [Nocardia thailandica]|uniref:phage tail termination protein n=2 Tax=Nocardia thailandica TaxID=257275 RepID=UPI00402BCF9B